MRIDIPKRPENRIFTRTNNLAEAVVHGLLVEKRRDRSGFLATPPAQAWFPRVVWLEDSKCASSRVPMETRAICSDKAASGELLMEAGIPVPRFRRFVDSQTEEARAWCQAIGWPVVLKPIRGTYGRGVTANVQGDAEFYRAISILKERRSGGREFLAQKHVHGTEYRFLCSSEQVLAVFLKVPAAVIGDGESAIPSLVAGQNRVRKRNPYLSRIPINLNDEAKLMLEKQGLEMTSVPDVDQVVVLSSLANIHAGGHTVVVTDEVHPSLKDLAVKGLAAIPGLEFAGLDIILTRDHTVAASQQSIAVIEVNSTPGLGGHLYPMFGLPRNVCAEIVRETAEAAGMSTLDRPGSLTVVGVVLDSKMTAASAAKMLDDLSLASVIINQAGTRISFALSGSVDDMTYALTIVSRNWKGTLRVVRNESFVATPGKHINSAVAIPSLPASRLGKLTGPPSAKGSAALKGLRFVVSGEVQKVGYRQFIRRVAEKRKLTGWVKNRSDGQVEGVIFLPTNLIGEVFALLWQGPPNAKVTQVTTSNTTENGPKTFQILE